MRHQEEGHYPLTNGGHCAKDLAWNRSFQTESKVLKLGETPRI